MYNVSIKESLDHQSDSKIKFQPKRPLGSRFTISNHPLAHLNWAFVIYHMCVFVSLLVKLTWCYKEPMHPQGSDPRGALNQCTAMRAAGSACRITCLYPNRTSAPHQPSTITLQAPKPPSYDSPTSDK